MDYEKLLKALNIIQDTCRNNTCDTCPLTGQDQECYIEGNTPDEWIINNLDDWRAFK